MKQIMRAVSKILFREPEIVESAQREPPLEVREPQKLELNQREAAVDDLHEDREPEMVDSTQLEPPLEDLPKAREPEIVESAQREPPRDETPVQQTLPRSRNDAMWLEERPKVIETIKSGVAALRETSAQMRANRAIRNAAKTNANNSQRSTHSSPNVDAQTDS
jgi:hypothetical protein